jgi:hypothetical protein
MGGLSQYGPRRRRGPYWEVWEKECPIQWTRFSPFAFFLVIVVVFKLLCVSFEKRLMLFWLELETH